MRFDEYLNEVKFNESKFIEKIKDKCSYYIDNFYKNGIVFFRGEEKEKNPENFRYSLTDSRTPKRNRFRII